MNSLTASDPFQVLGVSRDAGEAEVRARYLQLVRQFPPERDPDKFHEIRTAYDAVRDPLSVASRLISLPGDQVPQWSDVLKAQQQRPPKMTLAFLLSLGNRATETSDGTPSSGSTEPGESAWINADHTGISPGDEPQS